MVRALAGDVWGDNEGPITPRHVEVATEVVRRKVLVGLADDGRLSDSLERFDRHLGKWDEVVRGGDVARCQEERLGLAAQMEASMAPAVDPQSEVYAELARRNWADVQLYHYVRGLYRASRAGNVMLNWQRDCDEVGDGKVRAPTRDYVLPRY